MKNYRITVNGNTYDVAVEETAGGAAPAAAPAPKAAPAPAPAAESITISIEISSRLIGSILYL